MAEGPKWTKNSVQCVRTPLGQEREEEDRAIYRFACNESWKEMRRLLCGALGIFGMSTTCMERGHLGAFWCSKRHDDSWRLRG